MAPAPRRRRWPRCSRSARSDRNRLRALAHPGANRLKERLRGTPGFGVHGPVLGHPAVQPRAKLLPGRIGQEEAHRVSYRVRVVVRGDAEVVDAKVLRRWADPGVEDRRPAGEPCEDLGRVGEIVPDVGPDGDEHACGGPHEACSIGGRLRWEHEDGVPEIPGGVDDRVPVGALPHVDELCIRELLTNEPEGVHEDPGPLPLRGGSRIDEESAGRQAVTLVLLTGETGSDGGEEARVDAVLDQHRVPCAEFGRAFAHLLRNCQNRARAAEGEALDAPKHLCHERRLVHCGHGVGPDVGCVVGVGDAAQPAHQADHRTRGGRRFGDHEIRALHREQTPHQGDVKGHVGEIAAHDAGRVASHRPARNCDTAVRCGAERPESRGEHSDVRVGLGERVAQDLEPERGCRGLRVEKSGCDDDVTRPWGVLGTHGCSSLTSISRPTSLRCHHALAPHPARLLLPHSPRFARVATTLGRPRVRRGDHDRLRRSS